MSKPKNTKKAAKTGKPLPKVTIDEKGHASIHEVVELPPAAEPKSKAPAKVGKDKAAKTPKAKSAREPKEDLVVFAFRLTPAERDAIHAAAGPAKASRFVRMLAVAAANGDEAGIQNLLKVVGAAK